MYFLYVYYSYELLLNVNKLTYSVMSKNANVVTIVRVIDTVYPNDCDQRVQV